MKVLGTDAFLEKNVHPLNVEEQNSVKTLLALKYREIPCKM